MSYPHTSKAAALPDSRFAHTQPLAIEDVVITGGPLARWQELNAASTIPHCIDNMEAVGVLNNFRRVVAESGADFAGFWFQDSDLYKVIEAVAWEIARSGTHEFDEWLDEVIALIARVQDQTGYVDTFIQGVAPERQFKELELTHEMYILGHMIQAAVALDRACGRSDLLNLATKFTDLIERRYGPGNEDGICGHPEIETALVELYRHTGEERYLRLAEKMINLRGHGTLPLIDGLNARYFQDHLPVRESHEAVGHAVRQLYLNAGVTDLYLETGEDDLLAAMNAQWESAHEKKMYISGAFGSRHSDEAFGDAYELPSDRAYAETCATIADIFWNWRLILVGDDSRLATYAETIEREIYNALAASIDSSGTKFFYSNPLQLRADRADEQNAPRERQAWYKCACCPPNIARTVAQLSGLLTSATDSALYVHQIAPMEVSLPGALGRGTLRVSTDYPSEGRITVSLDGTAAPGTELRIRVPSWAKEVTAGAGQLEHGYWVCPLELEAPLTLEFPVRPRLTHANPKVDALRGCVAIEVGPTLYCIEDVDLPEGIDIDSLRLTGARPTMSDSGDLHVEVTSEPIPGSLYGPSPSDTGASKPLSVRAIPFSKWGNRGAKSMRVWLPVAPA